MSFLQSHSIVVQLFRLQNNLSISHYINIKGIPFGVPFFRIKIAYNLCKIEKNEIFLRKNEKSCRKIWWNQK